MTYKVEVSDAAERQLDRLDATSRRRVLKRLERLADEPRPPGCRKLVNSEYWRIRVGDYRVIYEIVDDQLVVMVVRVAHRREVYRR